MRTKHKHTHFFTHCVNTFALFTHFCLNVLIYLFTEDEENIAPDWKHFLSFNQNEHLLSARIIMNENPHHRLRGSAFKAW